MVIIQAAGGLGNQLQQYALYRKFVTMGVEARLDTSWFTAPGGQERVLAQRGLELDYFDRLMYETCTDEERKRLIGGRGLTGKLRRKLLPATVRLFTEEKTYHPEVLDFTDMYLTGYFACEKYYADILTDLRELIRFPSGGDPRNHETALEMSRTESVSVHIRRGDYLAQENAALFGNICTEDYYRGAFQHIRDLVGDVHFYLFSDDSDYVREHYRGEEFSVVDWNKGKNSFYDIWLMSRCRYNICANSTFSFWGARLNGYAKKLMIRPMRHKNTVSCAPEIMQKLWQGWTLIDHDGTVFIN